MPKTKRQSLSKIFTASPLNQVTEPNIRLDRIGKKTTIFYLSAVAKKQLAFLAIEQETTQQALLSEALNNLFKKYGKQPIA